MATKIQLRRDTATNWSTENPILSQGEIGFDLTNLQFKIGDGTTAWNSLDYFVDADVEDHIADTENPHSVTKTQVGLGNVANYSVATQTEAEAGNASNKFMTPERTKQAILQLSPPTDLTDVNNHIADTDIHFTQANISITESQISDFGSYEAANENIQTHIAATTGNPHGVTATDVGLGDVENYGISTQVEAQEGTINNKYMTPLRTAQAIAQLSPAPDLSDYDDHIADSTIHFAQADISINESQITDLDKYTQTEVDTALALKSDDGHSHTESDITDLDKYTQSEVDTALALKAPLASPAFTGVPTAPTTATSDDSTRIATTAYVKSVVEDLIGNAPEALDTLNELATALANDAEFSATITTALAGKLGSTEQAVDSDKVDGYHIVVGSTGSDANTLYFIT